MTRSPLLHGADDRRDVASVGDRILRGLALESTLALVAKNDLCKSASSDDIDIQSSDLRSAEHLCDGEAFGAQPTLARCTGVLVDDDLVLTVAHCATNIEHCSEQTWAFGYAITNPEQWPRLAREDLYRCRSIPVLRYETLPGGERFDYALVQLDRPVSAQRKPAVLASTPVISGEPLCVIGFPSGLPVKIDCGALAIDVRDAQQDFLQLTSDTFRGSSGSGVFRAGGELVAVLARGGPDYDEVPGEGCRVGHRISDVSDLTGAEQAGYAAPAIRELCDRGWASSRLCGTSPRCGDNQCSSPEHEAESAQACLQDCPVLPLTISEPVAVQGCQVTANTHRRWPTEPLVGLTLVSMLMIRHRVFRRADSPVA
ncbi:MAG TPA: serine protease [Polyangiaceae bacterium]|nr:serine protease [Polyangiaceae bacterium]